jgi:oligopeptide transport system substrate-binding protein
MISIFISEGGEKMRGNKKLLARLLPSLLYILTMLLSACGGNTPPPQTSACGTNTPTKQASTYDTNMQQGHNITLSYNNNIQQQQGGEKAPDAEQIFHRPTAGEQDFGTLDPALVRSLGDGYAVEMIFTGLVQLDNNGNIKDQMAQSHEVSQDGLTYTFHLRPNLKFSDGTPLTAKDVAYSINRTLLPETHSKVTSFLNLIQGYTDITSGKVPTLIGTSLLVKDDNTISIVLSKPAAYFLYALTYPTSYVVEKSLIDKYGTGWTDHLTEGGGAGPFKVQTYTHNQTFNIVPNPNYYGPQPALKEIDMAFSGNTSTTYTAYKNGQYDWAMVPGANLNEAQGRADFYSGPGLAAIYVNLNYLAKPFNNIKIRQAFALAINKEILTNTVAQGAGIPTNNIVPNGMYGYNSNLKGPDGTTSLKGNPTLAQQLLAQGMQEEGYANLSNLPTLTLTSTQGNPTLSNVIQEIAKEWKEVLKVDVKVDLSAPDVNALNQKISGTVGNNSLQMWVSGWAPDYPDPQDWLTVFFGTKQDRNTNNYGNNCNKNANEQQDVQAQLDKADKELDSTKRVSLYNGAEQKLVNDVAWIPIYQSKVLIVQNPKLHGYKTNPLQITDPDSWTDVYFTV